MNNTIMGKEIEVITPYAESSKSKKDQVEEMFDSIAPKYDFLNHFLSLGIDNIWRAKTILKLKKHLSSYESKTINTLDIATGTGDLAITIAKKTNSKVTGLDLSENMLRVAQKKAQKKGLSELMNFIKGDSEDLPFEENSFDAVTVAFGIRNFSNREKGLKEMLRVLKPNGQLLILELSIPDNRIIKALYLFYFKKILPSFGKWFSKDNSAYSYLPDSVVAFPSKKIFTKTIENCGFKNCDFKSMTMGTVCLFSAQKPL